MKEFVRILLYYLHKEGKCMSKVEFTVDQRVESDTVVTEYDLPFYRINRTTITDPLTGKKKVTKKVTRKSYDDIVYDAIIIGVTATSINLIGNGISHMINSIKRKNQRKGK